MPKREWSRDVLWLSRSKATDTMSVVGSSQYESENESHLQATKLIIQILNYEDVKRLLFLCSGVLN